MAIGTDKMDSGTDSIADARQQILDNFTALGIGSVGKATTTSTSKDTGCVVLEGGFGVEENINAGGYVKAIGNVLGAEVNANGAASTAKLNSRGVIALDLQDDTAMAADVGGLATFSGKYKADGTYTTFASVKGIKENATEANDASALVFKTKATGGSLTEQLRISSAGVVDLAKGQLKFPATQNASADANTLDDYQEDTFTPTADMTGGATLTYSPQFGKYTKVGNVVTFTLYVGWLTSSGTNSGKIKIGGLPYTSNATSGYASSFAVRAYFFTTPTGELLQAIMSAGVTTINLETFNPATGDTADLDYKDTGYVCISGSYFV